MINKLSLKNWKCYDSLELRFEKGVNFIIGHNGIGKTSLLEALVFGLLGRVRTKNIKGYKKIGSKGNTEVKLKLEDHNENFEIIRNFNGKYDSRLIKNQSGQKIESKDEILRYLEDIFDSSQVFFENIIFSSEGEVYEFLQLNSKKLVNYLETIIGIGKTSEFKKIISEVNNNFKRNQKKNEDYLKILKDIELKKEKFDLIQLKEEQKEKKLELNIIKEQLKSKEAELVKNEKKIAELSSYYNEYKFLSQKVQNYFDVNKDIFYTLNIKEINIKEVISEKKNLDLIRINITRELDENKVKINSIEEKLYEKELRIKDKDRVKMIIENLEFNFREQPNLNCPICQKILSKNEFLQINQEILNQTNILNKELADLKGELNFLIDLKNKLKDKFNFISNLYDLIKSIKDLNYEDLQYRNSQKDDFEKVKNDLLKECKSIEEKEEKYKNKLREIEELITRLEMAEEIKDKLQIEQDYKKNIKGKLITEITQRAIDEIISKQRNINLKDLIDEIKNIWKLFFPFENRELYFDNKYLPFFRKGRQKISFDNISGGEKMVLLILIKTVLLKMYTKIPFLIFDEPLEHLNLENRINIVDYLVDVYKKGFVNQLIITTFEESLTRKFRNMEDINIISLPSIIKYKY